METPLECEALLGRVQDLFASGHSCAQSVLCAFAPQLGLRAEDAFRISASFGGGMGVGEVCGAVAGAIMVLGLTFASRRADTEDAYAKALIYVRCREFMNAFKVSNGSLCCRDLIGFDLGRLDSEQDILNTDRNLYVNCPGYVRSAVEILTGMLDGSEV